MGGGMEVSSRTIQYCLDPSCTQLCSQTMSYRAVAFSTCMSSGSNRPPASFCWCISPNTLHVGQFVSKCQTLSRVGVDHQSVLGWQPTKGCIRRVSPEMYHD